MAADVWRQTHVTSLNLKMGHRARSAGMSSRSPVRLTVTEVVVVVVVVVLVVLVAVEAAAVAVAEVEEEEEEEGVVEEEEKDKPNSTTMNGSPCGYRTCDQVVKIEPTETEPLSLPGKAASGGVVLNPMSPYSNVKPISPEQEELIHRLVYFQNEYEQPSEDDLKKITVRIADHFNLILIKIKHFHCHAKRPNLIESVKVEKIQEIYLEALKAYVDNRRKPKSGIIFAKLLSVLTELRTLGNQNNEMCYSLKFKNKKLPLFLAEIWDVGT
ncbi:hypothetical protein M0804_006998 [Polistes exclamans]|nr:hypothetical protein M0804_006998 [Polistes exclamans]